MKKAVVLICSMLLLTFISCEKDSNKLRVINSRDIALNIKFGDIDFGRIQPSDTTSYKTISRGSYKLSGDAQGTITIDEDGEHLWTVVLNSDLSISLQED